MCHHCKRQKCHKDRKTEDSCSSKKIKQCHFDKHRGIYVIDKSGHYHLSKDVKGTILIQTNDVSLDLCCHSIDANGAANAIVIKGDAEAPQSLKTSSVKDNVVKTLTEPIFRKKAEKLGQNIKTSVKVQLKSSVTSSSLTTVYNVSVYNGSVMGSSDAGILIESVFDVSLSELSFRQNSLDSIRVSNSNSIKVTDGNFSGKNVGERALSFEAVDNISVKNCNASDYLSTIGAILSFSSCNCGSVKDVNICGNTKTSGSDVGPFAEGTAFVYLQGSKGLTLTRVKVNENTFNNNIPVDSWRTAHAILLDNSKNTKLIQCETSDNTDIAGNSATLDTEDLILCLLESPDTTISEHKGNNNTCPETLFFLMSCAVFSSDRTIIKDSQFNGNVTANLELAGSCVITGIWSSGYFLGRPNDVIIKNTQCNFNRLENGGEGRTNDEFSSCIGLYTGGIGFVVDNCQFNNNSVGDSQPFTGSFGLESTAIDEVITNCSANFNTGGGTITCGISLLSSNNTRVKNRLISNCTASSNGRWGLLFGDTIGEVPGENVLVENCTFHNNGGDYEDCAGIIAFVDERRPPTNITIRKCHVSDSFSNVGSASGIKFVDGNNIVIDSTEIHRTSGLTRGDGILIEGGKQVNVKNCEVYDMKSSLVDLLKESGAGPEETDPYVPFSLDISMRGGESVNVEFSKDSIFYAGVDSMYFYLEDLEITNPVVGPIAKPLVGAPAGPIPNGTSFDINGLRFTAISFGPWEVADLDTAVPPITAYSGDASNETVIRCGFQEPFLSNPGGPGNTVAPFNAEVSLFTISPVDSDPNREYTFKILLRNSSEPDFDFLTVSKLVVPVNHGIHAINADNIIIEDTNVMKITGDGIVLDTVTNSKILRSQAHSISKNGFELREENSKVSLIENIAINNDKGFVISDGTSLSLVQDNRAVGNTTSGFEQDASGDFSTAYIGNEAQNDLTTSTTDNYSGTSLTAKINLQELKLSDGNLSVVNGNAVLGARVANLSTIN